MNTKTNQCTAHPDVRNLRKNFLPLLLAVAGVLTGGSVGKAATAVNIDFSSASGYDNTGTVNLVGQNGWAAYGANSSAPIKVSPS